VKNHYNQSQITARWYAEPLSSRWFGFPLLGHPRIVLFLFLSTPSVLHVHQQTTIQRRWNAGPWESFAIE
jgi:hypothetical protein